LLISWLIVVLLQLRFSQFSAFSAMPTGLPSRSSEQQVSVRRPGCAALRRAAVFTLRFAPRAKTGAHDQDRTDDLILTKDVLYRLSYMGTVKSETFILIPNKRQKTIAPAFCSQKS
jgi:hypothetical protein